MRTSEAVAAFIMAKRAKGLAPSTIALYRWGLAFLGPELPRSPGPLEATLTTLDMGQVSKLGVWKVWRVFFRWSNKRLHVKNPMIQLDRPRVKPKLRRFLAWNEVLSVLTECPLGAHDLRGSLDSLLDCPYYRDHVMVHLAMDTGMRNSELANLGERSFMDGGLKVDGKSGERLVKVSPEMMGMLRPLRNRGPLWIGRLGQPMTGSGVQQVIQRVLRRAGIHPPKAGPHLLRHSFATWYIAQGGNVVNLQYLLGHQELSTTMIYVHMSSLIETGRTTHISPRQMIRPEGKMWEEIGNIVKGGDIDA